MPAYKYKARDKQGELLTAIIDAENETALAASLRSMGYSVISIAPQAQPRTGLADFFAKFKKSHQYELIFLNRQLASMLKSGISMTNALTSISEQIADRQLKAVIGAVLKDIKGGLAFSAALAKHPRMFSEVFISMVKVGETAGALSDVLERAARLGMRELDVKTRLKSAMVYPIILMTTAIIIVAFLLINIVPKFVTVFESYDVRLPLATQILLAVSFIARRFFAAGIILIIAAALWLRKYLRTEKGRYCVDAWMLRLPLFGELQIKVIVARFSQTLGTLLKSGVPILEALYVTQRTINNSVIRRVIENTRSAITEGRSLTEPLKASGVFPATIIEMVALGEKSGTLDQMLLEVAQFYDQEVEYTIKNITTALEPLLLLVMGSIVAFIALAVLLPIFNLVKVFKH